MSIMTAATSSSCRCYPVVYSCYSSCSTTRTNKNKNKNKKQHSFTFTFNNNTTNTLPSYHYHYHSLVMVNNMNTTSKTRRRRRRCLVMVKASSSSSDSDTTKYEEYEVEIEQPYGLKFAKGRDGGTYIDAIAPGGSAAKTGLFSVGDKVIATSAVFGTDIWPAAEYGRTMYTIRQRIGPLLMRMQKRYGNMDYAGERTEKEIIKAERNSGVISNRVREIQLQNYVRKKEQKEQREKDLREGLQLYKNAKYEEALEKFESVLGSRPSLDEASVASYNVACCYSKLNQIQAGVSALEDALEAGFEDFKELQQCSHSKNGVDRHPRRYTRRCKYQKNCYCYCYCYHLGRSRGGVGSGRFRRRVLPGALLLMKEVANLDRNGGVGSGAMICEVSAGVGPTKKAGGFIVSTSSFFSSFISTKPHSDLLGGVFDLSNPFARRSLSNTEKLAFVNAIGRFGGVGGGWSVLGVALLLRLGLVSDGILLGFHFALSMCFCPRGVC